MENEGLDASARRMVELTKNPPAGMTTRRIEAERGRITMHILDILTPSVRKFVRRKNMNATDRGDIDQHVCIAIDRAVDTWIPEKSTFSTYVHWKIMAELQALQWKEYPDRRRLILKQPIKMVEIDRPIRRMDDGAGDFTVLDMLVDVEGEARTEEGAATYMAHHRFQKVMSHYVVRQLNSKKAPIDRYKVMRDYDIYRTRVLLMGTLESLALNNGVTRERIRQIVKKVDDGIKGQLPTIKKIPGRKGAATDDQDADSHILIEATRAAPQDIHPDWDHILARHLADTGEDVAVTAGVVKRVHEEIEPVLDTVTTEIVPDAVDDAAPVHVANDDAPALPCAIDVGPANPVEQEGTMLFGKLVSFMPKARMLGGIAIAAASLGGSAMASAQSRAVPPEAERAAAATPSIATARVSKVEPATQAAAAKRHAINAPARLDPVVDVGRGLSSEWGVALTRYDSLDALRHAAPGERRGWMWLKGLDAGYRGDAAGGYRIAFGPLTKGQAEGLCHEARRAQRACDAIQYGGTAPT